jgi:GDPmannose 4,6-dehydratase
MWLMLQNPNPMDCVIATGIGATVKDFAEEAFGHAGLDWKDYVLHDERYERPTEVNALIGDPSFAWRELGWKARTSWKELAKLMVEYDLKLEEQELA